MMTLSTASSYTNISPAKKLRSLKRLLTFQKKKLSKPSIPTQLSICFQEQSSVSPTKPNLSVSILPSTSLKPCNPKLSYSPINSISIPPKKIYHPAIIKACHAMFNKHPDQLIPDETVKFKQYRKWKIEKGEPIEEDIIYLPAGGGKPCLHCNLPT